MRHDFVKHKQTGAVYRLITRKHYEGLLDCTYPWEVPSAKDVWFILTDEGLPMKIVKDFCEPCYADGRTKLRADLSTPAVVC